MNQLFNLLVNLNPFAYEVVCGAALMITAAVLATILTYVIIFFKSSLIGYVKTVSLLAIATLISYGIFETSKMGSKFEEYSQQELGDLVLTSSLDLKKYDPAEKTTSLGRSELVRVESPANKLGRVNCGWQSFKNCIAEIKANKVKIVADLKAQSTVVQVD